ncbi:hypothetical protein DL96DRAFT_1609838 [Flagelloscypha sp. PMI_526]|nr:hypothetical protein DL96DRAFT_1609838 [Flagelloscypha sp. PMI_526]
MLFNRRLFAACLSLLPILGMAEQIPITPPSSSTLPTLADLLTLSSQTSIFFDYARELSLSKILADNTKSITVLAPVNKAVIALPRKPHQSPDNQSKVGVVITEEEYETQSSENVRRWVSAHIIPESPISFAQTTYPTLLEDRTISFALEEGASEDDWSKVTMEDETRIVERMEASNGVLYIIDTTVIV